MSTATLAPAIRVQGVEKAYGDLAVLRGVDLEVAPGSIFALLGSNGAGKTTLVKILATLLRADTGSAEVNGFDVRDRAGDVREPGAVADRLLERFDLVDAGDRKAGTYSGGMRRRLDIAMSLIGDPPVVVLDEPTTGLDPQARIEVWKTVRQLAESGTTVLLTTQYLDEAEHLADRIAILHGGRIVQNGTLDELKKLLPPARVEYVEKQPSLEEVFLALVGGQVPTAAGKES